MHARDVLAQALVVHLAAVAVAAPAADAALLVLPGVPRAVEMEVLEVANDAGRREVVERDTA